MSKISGQINRMIESNYDILGITEEASSIEIREAFRKLALQYHSDRGGEDEKFKKIKQAYEDLKIGKKYPETDEEKLRKSKVYSGESEEDIIRRNLILSEELAREMKLAEKWADSLSKTNSTGVKLFGSKTLGQVEFERKATGAISIKGNIMAGKFSYDGHVIMQGNINSPTYSEENKTLIHLKKGDFKFLNPIENKYRIENGAILQVDNGDIIIGNVFGRKLKLQDPEGRVGIYLTKELRTSIHAPNGKIVAENLVNTVQTDSKSLIALNLEDDVKISAKEILLYGNKVTYDCQIELKKDGVLRFFENYSIQGLSDDATIKLDNGKAFRLHDLKIKKIKDISDEFLPEKLEYKKDDTIVGNGFSITYAMLDNFDKKQDKGKWSIKFGRKK